MRYVLMLWAAPILLFWSWFGLSYYNVNFGYVLMTREAHDLIFQLYGEVLGIDPESIPWFVAKSCVFDFFLLMGIWAYRRRRTIAVHLRTLRDRYAGTASAGSV